MTFTVVLTGGIAAGKTAVSDRFARLGVPVIDTDVIAREIVEPGQPALEAVKEVFGPEYYAADGRMDRKKIRQRVFSDEAARKQLEAILHPAIAAEVRQRVGAVSYPYCVLVIPLFGGGEAYAWTQRVLVVDVTEETQLQRVMQRDDISRPQAQAILDAQISRKDRLLLADDLIDNSACLSELDAQVEALHLRYLELASTQDKRP